jgi:hypothetical protein
MWRDEAYRDLDDAFADFCAACDGLDEHEFEEKWLDGRWGVREIAAHLTGWHGQFAASFERLARGEPLNSADDWHEIDELNHTFAEHTKGKQKQQVMFELSQAVDSLRTSAGKVPDELFQEGKIGRKLFEAAGTRHFREHADMVQAWLAQHQRVGS